MRDNIQFPVTNYSNFPEKFYFLSIAKNIIKIGNLRKTKNKILDYGCGNKIFSKLLKNKKIINYDINPHFTEVKNFQRYNFDLVILNHVLMYMTPLQITNLFKIFKKKNPKCKFLIGIGKQNFFSKVLKIFALNFKAHNKTKCSYEDQIKIINKFMNIKNKKNIFFITDIFLTKF